MQGFVVKQLSEFDLNQLKKKRHTNWFLNVGAFLTWNPALIVIPSAAGLGLLGYMMVSIIVTGEGLDMTALIMLTIASPILLFVLFSMIASQRRDSQYEAAVESLPALVETENSLKEWFSDHYNMKLRDGYWYMSSFEDTPGKGSDQILKSLALSLLENLELTRTGNIMFSVGANEIPLKAELVKQDNGEWMLIKANISCPVYSSHCCWDTVLAGEENTMTGHAITTPTDPRAGATLPDPNHAQRVRAARLRLAIDEKWGRVSNSRIVALANEKL